MTMTDATFQVATTVYVTVSLKAVELKQAMLHSGSSLYIISLIVLDVVGIHRDRIMRHPIEVSSCRGNITCTIGFVNLDSG